MVDPPWPAQSRKSSRALNGSSKRGEHTQPLSHGETEHRLLFSVYVCETGEWGRIHSKNGASRPTLVWNILPGKKGSLAACGEVEA